MRRRLAAAVLALLALGGPTHAASFAEDVIRQLQAQGFSEFDILTTLLGRTRIIATGANGRREIVLNPLTGEILRDLWLDRDGDDEDDDDNRSGTSGGQGGSSGDDGDDDGDDGDRSGSGRSGDSGSDDGDDD